MTDTLFITNIDTKLKRERVRLLIYLLFTIDGCVNKINFNKKNRNQIFVKFDSSDSAIEAFKKRNGFLFMGKKLKIQMCSK